MSTIIPSDIGTLSSYAQDLLDVCADALADTTAGTPADVFLDVDAPAYDCCPALVLVVPSLTEAATSPLAPVEATAQRSTLGRVNLATYQVYTLRCAAPMQKNGNPPTSADKQAVAVTVQEDMWAIWNGVNHAVQNGLIFDTCTGVHFDGIRPIRAQGGCVGSLATFRAMIPGVPNDSS
jgi:hypothetical protein